MLGEGVGVRQAAPGKSGDTIFTIAIKLSQNSGERL